MLIEILLPQQIEDILLLLQGTTEIILIVVQLLEDILIAIQETIVVQIEIEVIIILQLEEAHPLLTQEIEQVPEPIDHHLEVLPTEVHLQEQVLVEVEVVHEVHHLEAQEEEGKIVIAYNHINLVL